MVMSYDEQTPITPLQPPGRGTNQFVVFLLKNENQYMFKCIAIPSVVLVLSAIALPVSADPGLGSDAFDRDATRLYIGDKTQFFFDNLLVESAQNLTRKAPPRSPGERPLIKSDKPWEHVTYFTCNAWRVLRDPEDGLFKCWYEDWQACSPDPVGKYGPWNSAARLLFARSKDGLTWEKPELGLVEDGRKTNIVFGDKEYGGIHAPYVFLDPLEDNREDRYKMLFFRYNAGGGKMGVHLASSADGIHWKPQARQPNFGWSGSRLTDVITLAVDESTRTYLLNNRHAMMPYAIPFDKANPKLEIHRPHFPHNPLRQNKRRVHRSESADLLHWSDPQPLLVPDDELDNIDDSFYGMVQYRSGSLWIGFLNVFHMTDNTIDVQLVYSRDGRNFKRFRPGQPWLRTGEPGSWNQFMVNICSPPVTVGDDLYVYHGGAKNHHCRWLYRGKRAVDPREFEDIGKVGYCLGLVKMKRDRFVSLSALRAREGILVTNPFYSDGGKLMINAKCANGGHVAVQVANGAGEVIPGFEKGNCNVFSGDAVSHEVTWKDSGNLPKGWMKLHFFMRDADLYTFQLTRK